MGLRFIKTPVDAAGGVHPASRCGRELAGIPRPNPAAGNDAHATGSQVTGLRDRGQARRDRSRGMVKARRSGAKRVGHAKDGEGFDRGTRVHRVIKRAMKGDLHISAAGSGGVDDLAARGSVNLAATGEHPDHDAARARRRDTPSAPVHRPER